jgi:CheY-like chemotaxis protein
MEEPIDFKSSAGTTTSSNCEKTFARRPRVLIAEDDWAFRDLLLFAFEEEGYDVVTVADGTDFLEVLRSSLLPEPAATPFDLVVSDIRMPGWSGLTVLEKLRKNARVPPVVIITAFGNDEVHRLAEQAGAVAVLDKPFDISDLTALGHRMIAQHVA